MNQPSYESPLGEIYIKTLDGKWKRFKPKLSDELKDIIAKQPLKKTSVNCAHAIVTVKGIDYFCKIELGAGTDSLTTETIYLKYLNAIEACNRGTSYTHSIFPKYIANFKGTTTIGDSKILVTSAIPNPISLGDYLDKYSVYNTFIENLHKFITYYSTYGSKYSFVHSDLHLNNIMLDDLNLDKFYMIDFGRSYSDDLYELITDKGVKNFEKEIAAFETYDNYNFQKSHSDFCFSFLLDKELTKYRYLIDIASVTLNIIRYGLFKSQIVKVYYLGRKNILVIPNLTLETELSSIKNKIATTVEFTEFEKSMVLLSCYLNLCIEQFNLHKGRSVERNGNEWLINLRDLFESELLFSNGYMNFIDYHDELITIDGTDEKIPLFQQTFNEFSNIIELTNTITQGGKKLKRKMKGGVPLSMGMALPWAQKASAPSRLGRSYDQTWPVKSFSAIYSDDKAYEKDEYINDCKKSIEMILVEKLSKKSIEMILVEKLSKNSSINNSKNIEKIPLLSKKTKTLQILQKYKQNNIPNDITLTEISYLSQFNQNPIVNSCSRELFIKDQVYTPQLVAATGGHSKKGKKIYSENGRKYIKHNKIRWYLDKNRGKYRYLDDKKDKIYVLKF